MAVIVRTNFKCTQWWSELYGQSRWHSESHRCPCCVTFFIGCSALGITGDCCPSAGGVNLACCPSGSSESAMSGEFKALIYADQACEFFIFFNFRIWYQHFFIVIDKTTAWNQIVSMTDSPGVGASRTNYLLWTASRPKTIWNNMSLQDLKQFMRREKENDSVRKFCSDNSACKAIGIAVYIFFKFWAPLIVDSNV